MKRNPPADPFSSRFVYETGPEPSYAPSSSENSTRPLPVQSQRRASTYGARALGKKSRCTWFGRVAQVVTAIAAVVCVGIIILGASSPESDAGEEANTPSIPTAASTTPPSPTSVTLGPEAETYVRQLVLAALRDPVGRRDFALQAGGAKVFPPLTSPPPSVPRSGVTSHAGPSTALRDDLRNGECWRIPGGPAQLAVVIPELIYVTHVTIDHVPIEVASDIGEAPRKMFLWGVVDGKANDVLYHNWTGDVYPPGLGRRGPPISGKHRYVLLATLEYDIHAPFHIQTFPVDASVLEASFYFGIVVLEVVDNWGGDHTCLYRLRIHGQKAFQ